MVSKGWAWWGMMGLIGGGHNRHNRLIRHGRGWA